MSAEADALVVVEQAAAGEAIPRNRSPLWMVSQEPLLNDLVGQLSNVREELEAHPARHVELSFSRAHLRQCRTAFDRMIRRGEEGLHRLCELFCNSLVGAYQLQSVVIGETPATRERFTLTQILSREDLYSTIDLDLGSRQLRKLQYFDGTSWVYPTLVANMVEYQPTEPNSHGVHKIISRIKAEEELWNKVVDEIFGLDSLVKKDKELRHLSYYVKDIFGVKIIVSSAEEAVSLHSTLEGMRWNAGDLSKVDHPTDGNGERLLFLETKDYIHGTEKGSGWEAIKSVVSWSGRIFEIQIQPLANFWREREHLTRESHAGFKSRREQVRQQVAERIPLFRFYQSLLKWLFHLPNTPAPTFDGVSVALTN